MFDGPFRSFEEKTTQVSITLYIKDKAPDRVCTRLHSMIYKYSKYILCFFFPVFVQNENVSLVDPQCALRLIIMRISL